MIFSNCFSCLVGKRYLVNEWLTSVCLLCLSLSFDAVATRNLQVRQPIGHSARRQAATGPVDTQELIIYNLGSILIRIGYLVILLQS
jgi:hypothetical protein